MFNICSVKLKQMSQLKSQITEAEFDLSNSANDVYVTHTSSKTKRIGSAKTSKIAAVGVILFLSGAMTLSYLNGNIFMEKLAICSFIIICIMIVKLLGDKH